MKKRMIIYISVLALSVMTAGCSSDNGNNGVKSQQNTTSQTTNSSDASTKGDVQSDTKLTEGDAKTIALDDANVSEDNISHIRVKLERDDGVPKYEVEFYTDNKEYDYSINAATGEIISKDMEIENDFNLENSQNNSNSQNSSDSQAVISEDEAKKTALAKVEGATDQNIRIHLDQDDGRQIYEGSIYHEEREYEFEIDASTGEIISWEEESIYD